MAAKKRVDPIKQREKRAKIAAVAGCVLLLLVAAFEVPKMMKLMNKKPPVVPAATAQPVTGSASALPDVSGGAVATADPPASGLVDTDVPPSGGAAGQLVSFDVFETKNPFRPQVSADAATAPAAEEVVPAAVDAAASPPAPTKAAASQPPEPATAVPSSSPGPVLTPTPTTQDAAATAPPTTTAAVARTVSISVNGTVSRVARDGTFPSATPVFRLVSWTGGRARIGIVGGSYSTGDPTLTLERGKAVTLQNTSDGQRYTLVLLSTP